jgi:hypothetical protein
MELDAIKSTRSSFWMRAAMLGCFGFAAAILIVLASTPSFQTTANPLAARYVL